MTKEEALVMMQHGAYWADKVERGIAILFGPVFDPKGVWGLGVVEVENEGQVRTLAANDPAVKSGLQKMEIYPFHATLRK